MHNIETYFTFMGLDGIIGYKEHGMLERKLNWGLLSTARINQDLINPLTTSKRTRLLAVASRSQSTADAYALKWNIPRAHGSYESLLNDPEIDVVYNSLPSNMHAEWTVKALRAGKHVLCEKPIALTLAEMDAMEQTVQETGLVLAEAFMYRHHAQTLKIKEMVDVGELGKIQLIRGAFTYTLEPEDNGRWLTQKGGGSIWDVGCYPISYARTMLGTEPFEVFGWQTLSPGGSDLTFIGQMRFNGGIHAQFDSGFQSPVRMIMEIVGSEAVLNIPNPFKPGFDNEIYLSHDEKTQTIKLPGDELYLGEVEDMCDAIQHGKAPLVSLDDSRKNTAVIVALLESAKYGKPVIL
ncbi:MAG: gfo/Idh/MocA family oxidoreductase [Chloroflexi bacterium]|nr:MAG: gfo/Idh/MocA family oxidoreductase [Chloroflexota bacterium]